jgi:formyl-CoA transferase
VPYATLLMAKAGADAIKIKPPQGEPLRRRRALLRILSTYPAERANKSPRLAP